MHHFISCAIRKNLRLGRLISYNYFSVNRQKLSSMATRCCVRLDQNILTPEFLRNIDYILTDCDGVLWDDITPLPGSVEAIQALKDLKKHVIYVTNNSTKTREEFLKKCSILGFPATINDMISTPYCAATYLKSKNFQKKVYLFGSAAIAEELEKVGINSLPVGPDHLTGNWVDWLSEVKLDPEVGAVVVAFDVNISYPKLTKAASYLKDPNVLFIATNRDERCDKYELRIPCSGTFVSAVEVVSGRTAYTIGKPEKYMLDCVKHTYPDFDFSRALMIGDRLNTDILFGTKHGIKTLFVLTGVNNLEDVREFEKSTDKNDNFYVPDYYLPSLEDLYKLIKGLKNC